MKNNRVWRHIRTKKWKIARFGGALVALWMLERGRWSAVSLTHIYWNDVKWVWKHMFLLFKYHAKLQALEYLCLKYH